MNQNVRTNSTDLTKSCRYCGQFYAKKNSEHVFPYGLGGGNIFMDCVCAKCNNAFSGLEIELYQKSPIGWKRSIEGVEGYKPNLTTPAPLKTPILLTFDEENELVIEVGQYTPLNVFLRPQLIKVREQFYAEADILENKQKFLDKLKDWRDKNGTLTAKINEQIVYINFYLENGKYILNKETPKHKSHKAIQYCTLPEDYELYNHLSPRIFIDDDGRLKLRAKTLKEAKKFLLDFLNDTLLKDRYGGIGLNLSSPVIYIGQSFNRFKLEQAIVKIGLNCLMYYYPYIQEDPALDPCISYVMKGTPGILLTECEKNLIIDSEKDKHNILFFQSREGVDIRISLFTGTLSFSFFIKNLALLKNGEYNRLLIDYRKRFHVLQDTNAFFKSFSPALQNL